jgi:hypothetical protein
VVFFETQHEAWVALHPFTVLIRKKIHTMGIQYFMTLSGEKSTYHFLANDGVTTGKIHIIQGCGEQPDQDFLIFMQ